MRAVAEQPAAAFEDTLLDLAREGDDLLLSEVARAMGALRSERFLPALLPFLVLHEVRPAARDAFLAYGERGLRFLDEALADEDLPQDLRRHIPRTLSRFPDGTGAPVLLKHLLGEKDGMVRFKILRGLGRIATNHPDLSLDQGTHDLSCDSRTVHLSQKEFEVMKLLMQTHGVVSKSKLISDVWGTGDDVSENSAEAYISFLRKKLSHLDSTSQITTLRMLGYRLEASDGRVTMR